MDQLTNISTSVRYRELFFSFLKIGLFTFGGGYAMVPLIQQEVVTSKKWVEQGEFIDLLTLAQSVPGPIALNSAAFVGYKARGYRGALAAISGVVVPSFIIILAVAIFFASIRDNAIVEAAFNAMRPVVVALIVAPTITLMKGMGRLSIAATFVAMAGFAIFGISPAIPILVAAVAGCAWCYFVTKRGVEGGDKR